MSSSGQAVSTASAGMQLTGAMGEHLRHLTALPPETSFLRILGVNYVHLKTADEGDLYVTEFGFPFLDHLKPENWHEPQWFKARRERLEGTSTVYKVPTKPLEGIRPASLDLVVKWSRVGQEVPLDTFTLNKVVNAEFNTPFEEFSLVEELRTGTYGPSHLRILTQKPLAIYVPPGKMQPWQTGRSRDKILSKIARHPGIEIDILRAYILIYGWIKGVNAVEAYRASYLDEKRQQEELLALTNKVNQDLNDHGYLVADNKPSHIIVRGANGKLLQRHDGRLAYALIDYELLARTPEHENAVRTRKRSSYLIMQRERFSPPPTPFPAQLRPAKVMGVSYVFGRTESTNGTLWVVGRNPELFNYFLPERWRTKQIQLSPTNQTYYTQTKDRIHLVWKVSRVGELPPEDGDDECYEKRLLQGYNCPFEEFALALEMQRKGIKTTYPRAIYMTGQQSELTACIIDDRRFERFKGMLSPEELPILPMDRDFITLWGYWRGLEDHEASVEAGHWTPIDALRAFSKGIITLKDLDEIIARQRQTLAAAGYEDMKLRGDHVLLSYIPEGALKRDTQGQIELRQCNFEMVRPLS